MLFEWVMDDTAFNARAVSSELVGCPDGGLLLVAGIQGPVVVGDGDGAVKLL